MFICLVRSKTSLADIRKGSKNRTHRNKTSVVLAASRPLGSFAQFAKRSKRSTVKYGWETVGKQQLMKHGNDFPIASLPPPPGIEMKLLPKNLMCLKEVEDLEEIMPFKIITHKAPKTSPSPVAFNSSSSGNVQSCKGAIALENGMIWATPTPRVRKRQTNRARVESKQMDPKIANVITNTRTIRNRSNSAVSVLSQMSQFSRQTFKHDPADFTPQGFNLSKLYEIKYKESKKDRFSLVFFETEETNLSSTSSGSFVPEFVEVEFRPTKPLKWIRQILAHVKQVKEYCLNLSDQYIDNVRNKRVDFASAEGQRQQGNAETYARLNVDLTVLIYGVNSKETVAAIQYLEMFLGDYSEDGSEEATFWQTCCVKVSEKIAQTVAEQEERVESTHSDI